MSHHRWIADRDGVDLEANWSMMETIKAKAPWVRAQAYMWYPLPKTKLTYFAEEHYGLDIHRPICDYEEANFWVDSVEDGLKHRPWMDGDTYSQLVKWGTAFKSEFHYPGKRGPYVLDRVLRGEKIDLRRDLWQ